MIIQQRSAALSDSTVDPCCLSYDGGCFEGHLRDYQNNYRHFPQGLVASHPMSRVADIACQETLATAAGDAALAVQDRTSSLWQTVWKVRGHDEKHLQEKVRSKEQYVSRLEDCSQGKAKAN